MITPLLSTELLLRIIHFPFWLGDFIMSIPFAQAWQKQYEEDQLVAVLDPYLKAVFERSNLNMEAWYFKKDQRKALYLKLKEANADSVMMMTNSLGSLWPYWKAGVKQRSGFGKNLSRLLLNERAPLSLKSQPQGERFLALLKPEWQKFSAKCFYKPTLDKDKPQHLLLFPGAKYGPSKKWSHESYAALVTKLLENKWKVTILGTPDELEDGQKIRELTGESNLLEDLCGKMNLEELLVWLETQVNVRVLANDSGAMHLLAAAGFPTTGLYFSTSPLNTPPAFGEYLILEADIECRPCFSRECPKSHYNCRQAISVDAVYQALQR